MLAFERFDPPSSSPDQPPLLIAHGLYGSGRNWRVIARRLADARPVVTVDMRNHGESPRFDRHGYPEMAADLAEVIAAQGGLCDVCGHSMGGKAAMALALLHPKSLRRLIVADIAPVAYRHTQQQFIDAMRAVDLSVVTRRSEAEEQLAAAGVEPALRSFFTQSLDLANRRWRLNLDTLEQEMDRIVGWPDDITGRFDGPSLFLTGAESDYVLPEHREIIKPLFPQARFAKLPGAGHWLHADRPRAFEEALRVFLSA
ncbi:MAG: alpha/beta hydrolase [Rhodobacteraceae bacterium]|nr:alpha/beta hydrolase [Paracoccaceae bacterium]MBO29276.1 alpha/beta hydrolase [Paracoccaceae bacterium]